MIYAQISPVASKSTQSTPFSTPIIVTASYMTATARPYHLGASNTRFEIQFGNVILDTDGKVTKFDNVITESIVLTSEQLASWGSDDATVLGIIAAAVGTTVVATVTSK